MSDTASSRSFVYRTLECSICLEIYSPPNKIPKNLTCGHTFCSNCLGNVLASSKVKCSKCRKETQLTQGNIDELPTNFMAMGMLESTCEKCRAQQWVSKCDHCNQRLCAGCKKSHSEEEWNDLKEELIYAKKYVQHMAESYAGDNILEKIQSQKKAAEDDVVDFYDNLYQQMQQQKEADLQMTRLHFQNGSKETDNWQSVYRASLDQAASVITKCLTVSATIHTSEDKDSKRDDIKEEYTKALQDINLHLNKKPSMGILHVNKSLAQGIFGLLTNGVVNVTDVKHYDQINMKPLALSVSPTKKIIKRTRADYISATFSHSYGQKGSGPGEFRLPIDIATSPVTGNVVVSDYHKHRVHYLTSSLQPLSVYGSKGSDDQQLQHPWGVAVSNNGKVYIADSHNHHLHVTDENGKCLSVIKSDRFRSPRGLAVDNNGLLYVCDSENYQIQVIKEDGSFVRKFGSQGTNPGQFEYKPSYIAISTDNKLAVTDWTIMHADSGNVYILTTAGKHIRTIKSKQSGHLTRAIGVAFDSHDNIIVADEAGQLVVMKEDGQLICQKGKPGRGPGELQTPRGITLTPDGDILVCDVGNSRILKFSVPKVGL